MPVIVIATREEKTAENSKILWLFEDIWSDNNGDGELLLECIIGTNALMKEIKEILILVPYRVENVEDNTPFYNHPPFIVGYPKCWPDIYQQFKVSQNTHTIVTINGIEAKSGEIQAILEYTSPNCSEIVVKFKPPISSNERRIFRLGLTCRKIINKGIVPWAMKQIKFPSYGMAPFASSPIGNIFKDREKIQEDSWLTVEKHIISIELWEKDPIIISGIPSPSRCIQLEKCGVLSRFCPPLERMAKRLHQDVTKLKQQESYDIIWEFQNVLPSKGQYIDFKYFSSPSQKWISENWLSLLALILAIIALLFPFLKIV